MNGWPIRFAGILGALLRVTASLAQPVCDTCPNPCGSAQGFATPPTIQDVINGCTTADFQPALPGGSTHTFCNSFTATNTSVNFQVIITSTCGTGNVTNFSWTLFNSPSCGAAIQTGNLSNLTFTGLTLGNSYVFCYTFTVPFTCTHSRHCPYFVGAFVPPHTVGTTGGSSCVGGCTQVSATHTPGASGGFPPYVYTWSGGLPNGPGPHSVCPTQTTTYTVTVTDSRGISATATVTAVVHPEPTVVAMPTDVRCHGSSDGGTTAVPSGGTPPYTYSWNTVPPQTGPSVSGLPIGTYTVTVTDNNGCSATSSTIVGQPPELLLDTASTPASCGAANGSATAIPAGGTPPYTYSWNTTPPQTTPTATNLAGGGYSVTVTDANGCSRTVNAMVAQGDAATLAMTRTDVSCNGGNDGSATVVPSGGSPPFTYAWNTAPPQTGSTATGLPAGTWTVTVTDANGCSASANAVVGSPPALTTSASAIDARCQGGSDGSTNATGSGGTPPYSYSWNTTPPQATPNASGLPSGTYTVTITDANGCTATATAVVGEPSAVTLSTSATPDLCQLGQGSATVSASGGTPPYTYSWNTAPPQTTPTATGLPAGTYTVVVTDGNGCTATANVIVDSPPPLVPSTSANDVSCFGGNNSSATATPAGGTPPYTYSWNTVPPQTTPNASGLPIGTYTVTVTDNNGCSASVDAVVGGPTELRLTATPEPAGCGLRDGQGRVDPSGGTPPYTYAWNTTPPQNTQTSTGLAPGTWTVVVTDANGCSSTASVTVTTPTPGALSISHADVSCNGGADGTATVSVGGGNPPFTYVWNTTPPQTAATATNLPAGTWTVTVTDDEGCVLSIQAIVAQPAPIVPTGSSTPANCGVANGSASVIAAGGTPPYTYSWNTVPPQTGPTASNIPAGPYTVTITDTNGCIATASTTVDNIPGPSADFNSTDVCLGNATNFNNTSSSNAPPSTFSSNWDLGDGNTSTQTNPLHTYAGPGTYTVTLTVTDANGCTAARSRDITVHPIPVAGFSANPSEGCAPVNAVFANTNPQPGGTCFWTFGDGNTSTDCSGPAHTYPNGGCYDVTFTITSAAGCIGRQTQDSLICVTPDPVAYFTAEPNPAPDVLPIISFINGSSGATRYLWEFLGGNITSTLRDPLLDLTGADPGSYDACLQVWNDYGCVDSVCRVFRIAANPQVYVPNAFTPDGDGVNDLFRPIISGDNYEDYLLMVFNRWGELVFETNNPTMGWDGAYGGVISQTGVYVWKLRVRPENSADSKEFLGHVTLLR